MSKRKAPSADNPNQDFCEFLLELADYEKNTNQNIFKHNAYRKAASTLAALPKRITCGKEARKLDGIGPKIATKIDEFIQTGKLRKIENIRNDDESLVLNLLTRVSGIGPAKAHDLIKQGITSLDLLSQNKHLLNHHQLLGLKYFDDFEKKIPRKEIEQIEDKIRSALLKYDDKYVVTICGSYRRGKAESGDIDVLIGHPDFSSKHSKKKSAPMLKKIVDLLEGDTNVITDTISLGDVKFMGVCQNKSEEVARRLDIRMTPIDQYHCSTLYFTGSDMFNKDMRAHALQQGFTLNEYSLRLVGSTGVPGEPVPILSEKDIFEYINYPYKTPSERNM